MNENLEHQLRDSLELIARWADKLRARIEDEDKCWPHEQVKWCEEIIYEARCMAKLMGYPDLIQHLYDLSQSKDLPQYANTR